MEKLRIREAIVVEGRYDKNALSQAVDAVILETSGFGVFNDKEKRRLLRELAEKRGLILLTDSDGAGFVIRNHLKSVLPPDKLKQAYVPEISGKERRKKAPSKEGKLGVEGMSPEILRRALLRAGATVLGEESAPQSAGLTKAELYALGLSGKKDSAARRAALLKKLDLPQRLSTAALLDVLNALYEREELLRLLSEPLLEHGGAQEPDEQDRNGSLQQVQRQVPEG